MKRRFGMWMTIICILVVGVSVTKMTRDFVISQGVETAAIVSVMDAGIPRAAAGNMKESVKGVLGNTDETAAILPASDSDGTVNDSVSADAEPAAVSEERGSGALEMWNTDGPAAENYSVAAASEDSAIRPEAAVSESSEAASFSEQEPEVSSVTSESSRSKSYSREDAIQETVKSPLDPVVREKIVEVEEETVVYDAEYFFARFKTAESNSKKIWESVSYDNLGACNAAAEQERVLWDYELNLVYNAIKGLMSETEAENLKVQELEWIKERDLYAERMAAKGGKMNAQNQNPDYTRALADKTKERCYWLVSEYEELLNEK